MLKSKDMCSSPNNLGMLFKLLSIQSSARIMDPPPSCRRMIARLNHQGMIFEDGLSIVETPDQGKA
jgi:hypothetical protein